MHKFLYIIAFLFLLISCDRDYSFSGENKEAVSTLEVINVMKNSSVVRASLKTANGSVILERGVCFSTTPSPTIGNSRAKDLTDVNAVGNFEVTLNNLTAATKYYVRAYATNTAGTAYGKELTFTTVAATLASLNTSTATNITQTTAQSGGTVSDNGGSPVTQRGVVYSSTSTAPTVSDNKIISGSGNGAFAVNITGLSIGTVYYVRSYATNSAGTAYGNVISFKTVAAAIPSGISTNAVTNVTLSGAAFSGSVSADGGASITSRGFVYSATTSAPVVGTSSSVLSGAGTGSFNASVTGLQSNTIYYVRSFATNSAGTAYGNAAVFTTLAPTLPSGLFTDAVTNISASGASVSGSVSTDGGASITSRGFVYSSTTSTPAVGTSSSVTSGAGTGAFSSALTGLQPNTTYYVRSFATNSAGTAYGSTRSFTTLNSLAVGQLYNGGIIAYIFKSGDTGYVSGQIHGLIIPQGSLASYQWGCSGTSVSTSTSLGWGNSNTYNIVSACTSSSIAARYAYNLSTGGYSDWFLPSYSELLKIAENGSLLNLTNGSYWTSSQSSSSAAYAVNARTGSTSTLTKTSSLYILPVRQF